MVIGYTLMHEHTTIDLSKVKQDLDSKLDTFDDTVEEYKKLYSLGVRNILDVTNIGMGRDINYVKKVSQLSGINIISSTGYYKTPFLPYEITTKSIEDIANIMIKEIEDCIESSNVKAKVIGEIGTSLNEWTNDEKKIFEAAVIAHKETNALITTHTSLGTLGMEQVNFFKSRGINLSKVIIGHQDLNNDNNEVIEILKNGANIGFDTIGKNKYRLDDEKIDMLCKIQDLNLIDQVVLSMDITRRSHLKANGGIGYSYMFDNFIPRAKEKGISQKSINKMLLENPRRLLKGVI